jgi:hypothetical protein
MSELFKRKFTDQQIHDIRFSDVSNEEMGFRMNCESSSIARIRRGACYKDLPFDPEYAAKAHFRKSNTIHKNRPKI